MKVIESSGRSENHSRITCGGLATVDPAAGSLRFKWAWAQARAGHRNKRSARKTRGALIMVWLCLHSTHVVYARRGSASMKRAQSQEEEHTYRIPGTVVWLKPSGDKIESSGCAEANRGPMSSRYLPDVTELQRAYIESLS
jgi:hypothetical protein